MTTVARRERRRYATDAVFLAACLILAVGVTLAASINLLTSTFLFFGPPAAYLSWRRKDAISRTTIYATAITLISILTDYLAERDNSWVSTSTFDFRLAGSVPVEALVWMFLFTYLIVMCYLNYFDRAPHAAIGKRMPLVFLTALAILIWSLMINVAGLHFSIDYFYIKLGLGLLVPSLVMFTILFPRYLKVFLRITPYFFIFGMLNLLVSLEKGYWSYPGQHFIGMVRVGPYIFPWEELLFWIILFPSFLISQFELFNNDELDIKKGLTGRGSSQA